MRQLSFAIHSNIPRTGAEWMRAKDYIHAQWTAMQKDPFRGSVAVGYEWRLKVKPEWQKHAKLWPRIVWLASPIINGGEPYPGVCRFVQSDEPRLTLFLEAL